MNHFREAAPIDTPRGGFEKGQTELGGNADLYIGQSAAFLKAILTRQAPDRGALGDAVALMRTVESLHASL